METYSSGEDLIIKARKPYTITKQRERWTEEEHNRFLEALKLYGRAWQKIEEHIGTKTAVQIRSHAQKFFTKLEKEAVNTGVPIGQTHDIEIPPPRPKRKPSNPYPRKPSVESPSQGGAKEGKHLTEGSPMSQEKHILDLEKEPLLEICEGDGRLEDIDDGQNHNSGVINLLQAGQLPSQSFLNELTPISSNSGNSGTFSEFVVHTLRESINEDGTCKSILTIGDCKGQRLELDRRAVSHDNGNSKMLEFTNERPPQDKIVDKGGHSENLGSFLSYEVQATQSYPRHVPVHIIDGGVGMSATNLTPDISHQESVHHQKGGHYTNISISGSLTSAPEHQSHAPKSSVNQYFRNFLPIFPPVPNQDDYQANTHASSSFSNLIVSALMQNPAAFAAASFAATFWPCAAMESPKDENTIGEGFPSQHITAATAPSMAVIAGATVAAATAWWAANGLLPCCAPFQTAFSCSPTSACTVPMDTTQARAVKSDKTEAIRDAGLQDQQLDPTCSETLQEQNFVVKSPSASTSNSEEHEDDKLNGGISAHVVEEVETVTQLNDSNNLTSRKQVDRSSCGSNTSSSSDLETDALEKHEKGDEEPQKYDINHQLDDCTTRRGRIFNNVNDSWKEVSEEGRMAFQALFSRDVLPQSFYSRQNLKNNGNNIGDMQPASNNDVQLQPYGQHMVYSSSSNQLAAHIPPLISATDKKVGLPTMGTEHANLKTRRTGFKPYKRCSTEAKGDVVAGCGSSREDEKCPKRIRVEGGATTCNL